MLHGAGTGAAQALKGVVTALKEPRLQAELSQLDLSVKDLSSMLNGAGTGAAQALKGVVTALKEPRLQADLSQLCLLYTSPSPRDRG